MADTTYTGQQIRIAVKAAAPLFTDVSRAVNSITFTLDRAIRELYELSYANPFAIKEGNIKIRGTIEKKLSVNNFSATAVAFCVMAGANSGTPAVPVPLVVYALTIFPEGDVTPSIAVTGCKFSNYQLRSDQDGDVIESCEWAGLISVVTP